MPLIAYGILRGQLFDIDLRIRWTIKQSTLAGAIVAIISDAEAIEGDLQQGLAAPAT